MTHNLISKNMNRKLGKGIGAFNLPHATTCPGKTAVCARVCYAGKAARIYKTARESRQRNYVLSLHPDFAKHMMAEVIQRGFDKVRLHESGDVYSQEYLEKLFEACQGCAGTQFLMYTKSFHLDWALKPDNLVVYWSTDSSTDLSTVPAGGVRAHLVLKGEPIPARHSTCVHSADKHYCGTECQTCWIGEDDVYFPQH